MKTPEQIATDIYYTMAPWPNALRKESPAKADFDRILVAAIEADRAQRTVTYDQYGGICEAIDRAKNDDRSLDTDEYAGMVLDALGLEVA